MVLEYLRDLVHHVSEQYFQVKPRARLAFTQAERWATLCGSSILVDDYEAITHDRFNTDPIPLNVDNIRNERMGEIHAEQVQKVILELERLITIAYIQKMRIEQLACSDNWARDALGPVDAKINRLLKIHRHLELIRQGYHY